MSCGFGAVVLVFMIIDHSIKAEVIESNQTSQVEIDLLKSLIIEQEEQKTNLDQISSELSTKISLLRKHSAIASILTLGVCQERGQGHFVCVLLFFVMV